MKKKDMTLYGAVKSAALSPVGDALIYMGRRISYPRLMREIDAAAAELVARGVKRGEPVTVCLPNIPQSVILFYALNKIGAVAQMVHPLAPCEQLGRYMREVGSKLLYIPDIFAEKYDSLIREGVATVLCSPAHYLGRFKRTAFGLANAKKIRPYKKLKNVAFYGDGVGKNQNAEEFTDPKAPAVYLHSGGTSGAPKTIVLSSESINALCDNSYDILGIKRFDGGCMLAVLPLFHGFGLAMGVHAMLCHGGTDTLLVKFHTRDTIRLIERNEINYLIGVPALYEALLKNPDFTGDKLKNLRQAFVGGDYVPKRLLADFNARMEQYGSSARLYEGYGLTETVTVCAVNTTDAHRDGSVGKALGGMEIAAFDSDLRRLPAGEIGELCVAGDELMLGYLSDPEDNAGVFFTHEGRRFVRTGDLGCVDSDGFVFFKSRIKRMAKVNGMPVFPSEIEKLVMDERDDVREACAAAVPDDRTGSAVVLFVVPAEADLSEESRRALASELGDFVENRLGSFSRPKRVVFRDRFPQTLVGKVDVNALTREIE